MSILGNRSGGSYFGGPSSIGASVSRSQSQGGTYYLPWQENLLKSNAAQVSSQLQGQGPGSLESYQQWGGPSPQISGVTPSPIYSPELINQVGNSIWGNALAQGANQSRQAQYLRPGFGSLSPYLQDLQAGIRARTQAGAMQNMLGWQQTAAQQNAGNILEGQRINMGADIARAQADQNRYAMMQAVRGQDVQRENALLNALSRYIQPLQFQSSGSFSSSPVFY